MELVLLFILLFCLFVWMRYRLTNRKKIIGESEIIYKVIDIGQGDYLRSSFESLLGNKRIYLKSDREDIRWLYINKKDYSNLHPESWLVMKNENFSIKFKYETKCLIFRGMGLSRIISYQRIDKTPQILKS